MASEADNVLLDFGGGEPQKEVKTAEPSANPLYDFLESEQTNGHGDGNEVVLMNGDNQTMDLLDDSNDQVDLLGGPITVTSDDSGVTMDMNNVSETRDEEETVEDAVEEEVEVEEKDIEDDQDTGNVEDIGSEQTTEPEIDDQLDEQEVEPVSNVDNKPDVVPEPAPVDDVLECLDDEKEALGDGTNERDEVANGEELKVEADEEMNNVEEDQIIEEEDTLDAQDVPMQDVPQSVADEDIAVEKVEVDQVENDVLVEQVDHEKAEQTETNGMVENDDKQIEESLPAEEAEGVNEKDPENTPPDVEGQQEDVLAESAVEELEPSMQRDEIITEENVAVAETAPAQEATEVEEPADSPETGITEPESLQQVQSEDLPEIALEEQQEMETITEETSEQSNDPDPVSEDISSPDLEVEPEAVGEAGLIMDEIAEDQPTEDLVEQDELEIADGDKSKEDVVVKETEVEAKNAPEPAEEKAVNLNGSNDVKENGVADEEVRFAEMNNVRQKFESGAVTENEPTPKKVSVRDEYDQGGEFENTPIVNEDVVKETDQQKEELPEIGMAKNLLSRFKTLQEESAQTVTSQKRNSPPREEKVEYESQPTERMVIAESKSEEGVFESTPKENEGVVRSGEKVEDIRTAEGHTKGLLNRFKEIETESSAYKAREKRELTPDASGKVEYVSEPRGEHIKYEETKTEAGVYENAPKDEEGVIKSADKPDEVMPESGMAKNLLSKFKQLESETVKNAPPSPKRGKPYEPKPREQTGYLERYSPKLEEGEFESQPVIPAEVVRSGDQPEDYKPEAGIAKKTLERFKSMEQTGSPQRSPDYRKDFTPPRETSPGKTVAGVLENEPQVKPDVVRNVDKPVEELPEQGTARNILEKFKQIQSAENSPSESPTKRHKEFTPPLEAGVYENTPKEHLTIEQRQSESGVLESTPTKSVADIPRENQEVLSPEKELPEKGMAKNLVSKFKQLESESAKTSQSTSPRYKEFTPPRDTRHILSPKSPAEHQNGVHPSDLPEQYQEQTSPGIFESEPELRKDVYREADTDYSQGLPAKNTTRGMLEKFRNIQQKAKEGEETPSPVSRKAKDVQHE